MSGCRVFFTAFYAILAFLGLLLLGKGDLPLMIFGLLLMIFGLISAYKTIGRHFDEAKAH